MVSEATNGAVATCEADATVGRHAPNKKTAEDYGVVPVTSHGRLMGIIEREILRSVSLGTHPEQTKVTI